MKKGLQPLQDPKLGAASVRLTFGHFEEGWIYAKKPPRAEVAALSQ
jgi:hypothetical protein